MGNSEEVPLKGLPVVALKKYSIQGLGPRSLEDGGMRAERQEDGRTAGCGDWMEKLERAFYGALCWVQADCRG